MILKPGMNGRYSVGLTKATVSADNVHNDSYAGELQLILRGEGPDQIITNRTVAVNVAR